MIVPKNGAKRICDTLGRSLSSSLLGEQLSLPLCRPKNRGHREDAILSGDKSFLPKFRITYQFFIRKCL